MASYNHYQPIASDNWVISHGLNNTYLAIDVFKLAGSGVYEKLMPSSVSIINDNSVSVTFNVLVSGRARIVSEMV